GDYADGGGAPWHHASKRRNVGGARPSGCARQNGARGRRQGEHVRGPRNALGQFRQERPLRPDPLVELIVLQGSFRRWRAVFENTGISPLAVQRNIILSLLLILASLAWGLLLWQRANADPDMAMASPTMGLRAPLFLTIWVV